MKQGFNQKGFTLIELLVVIAIIALLLSVIMPALGLAKKAAKKIVCRSNVRSLTMGFRLYTETNDNQVFANQYNGKHTLWLDNIGEQLDDLDKVRYCPTTKQNPSEPEFDKWQPNLVFGSATRTWIWNFDVPEYEYGSYGLNGYFYYQANEDKTDFWNTSTAPNSASIPLFTDCRWVDGWPKDTDSCPPDFDISSGGNGNMMQRFIINRHRDELNVGFLDGHVGTVTLDMLWSLKWHRNFQTKGPQTRSDGTPIYQLSR